MQLIGSLVFTTFLFLWTFLYTILFVVVAVFLPFRRRFVMARIWAEALLWVLQWTCGLRYTVEGWEHVPDGNHIALWKHSSSWETIAMNVIFPRQVWVLKRELTWIPIIGWGIRLLHAIAIDRASGHVAVNQVVEQGRQRLGEGDWVMIFPEGTRMAPGETRRYGVSGALLAARAAQAARRRARGHRPADSVRRPRSACDQSAGAGMDRGAGRAARAAARHTSRFATDSAFFSMNSRRGST